MICAYRAGAMNLNTARQAMYVLRNTDARSFNHCCSGKAMRITYSDCVFVALVIQHAMHMRHIAICGLQAVQYFCTLSYKRQDFRKEKLLNTKCVMIFSTTFVFKRFSF